MSRATVEGFGKLPPSMCPACGHLASAASTLGEVNYQPEPGDISLCIRCAAVNVFAADLTITEAPADLMPKLREEDPGAARSIDRMRRVILALSAADPIPDGGGTA